MFKKLFFASFIFTSILNSQEPNLLGSLLYIEVEADVETEPVLLVMMQQMICVF